MNRPLHTHCPVCSGSGKVSWLRSGTWINQFCPSKNGPLDDDSSPCGHELDNYYAKKIARIEYKRRGEILKAGQRYHMEALMSATGNGWRLLYVLVCDEAQTSLYDRVKFRIHASWGKFEGTKEDTVEGCAKWICSFLWTED